MTELVEYMGCLFKCHGDVMSREFHLVSRMKYFFSNKLA